MILDTAIPDCRLRPWQARDVDALLLHADDRRIWRNLRDVFPHPYTRADAEFWVAEAGKAVPGLHLAIEWEGAAIGGVGLKPGSLNHAHTAEVGYWLGGAFWGRGLASAALTALLAHVDQATPYLRLEARVFAWNPASMRVLERCGFVREAVLRCEVLKDGALLDSVLYARVRPGVRSDYPAAG